MSVKQDDHRRDEVKCTQRTFDFLELPPELRNSIYKYYLDPKLESLELRDYRRCSSDKVRIAPLGYCLNQVQFPALATTCTHVMREILPMFFARQGFPSLIMKHQARRVEYVNDLRLKHVLAE